VQLIVTGSVAFDYIMATPTYFKDSILPDKIHILNVSFLVDSFKRQFGGNGGNIAYNLALLGYRPLLVAAAGRDFASYRAFQKKNGVNVSGVKVYQRERTAVGFVLTDKTDNQIWGFYQGAMRRARDLSLKKYLKPRAFVVIAPNDTQSLVRYVKECQAAKVPYLYDPAFHIPRLTPAQLRQGLKGAEVVVGNDYEIEMLKRRTGLKLKNWLKNKRVLVTTLGEKGSRIQQGKQSWRIPPAKPENTSDPTGAGDAYRAGFLAGFLGGLPLSACGRMGSVAAAYTVEKYGTQTHRFTRVAFKRRYQKNFGEKLEL
jgi:adenosine kinase